MPGRVKRRKDLAIVHRIDRQQNRIVATLNGEEHVWDVARIPSELRRLCVLETTEGMEPLSLFVGSNGLAIQRRAFSVEPGAPFLMLLRDASSDSAIRPSSRRCRRR